MNTDPKLRPLYLAQILYERTDEDHYLTTAQLMEILKKEYGIKDSDILAVMTSFIRNGREHSVNEVTYKVYSFVWMRMTPLRIFFRRKIIPAVKRLIKLCPA